MWDAIANAPAAIVKMAVLGALLSCLYGLFRVRRAVLPLPTAVVFAEDVLYCLVSGFSFFLLLLHVGNGGVRWWLIAAAAAGWTVCHFTVGFLVMFLLRLLLYLLRAVLYLCLRGCLRIAQYTIQKLYIFKRAKQQKMCQNTREN